MPDNIVFDSPHTSHGVRPVLKRIKIPKKYSRSKQELILHSLGLLAIMGALVHAFFAFLYGAIIFETPFHFFFWITFIDEFILAVVHLFLGYGLLKLKRWVPLVGTIPVVTTLIRNIVIISMYDEWREYIGLADPIWFCAYIVLVVYLWKIRRVFDA